MSFNKKGKKKKTKKEEEAYLKICQNRKYVFPKKEKEREKKKKKKNLKRNQQII